MAPFSRTLAATVLLVVGKWYCFLTDPSQRDRDHQYHFSSQCQCKVKHIGLANTGIYHQMSHRQEV